MTAAVPDPRFGDQLAEAQQGDGQLTAYTCPRWHRDPDGWCIDERPHLAARPSADTETLRDALRIHHPIMRSETGPFSGCRCGQVKLGQDVIAHVVAHLRAALAAEVEARVQAAANQRAAEDAALRHNLRELCDSASDGYVPVAWLRALASPAPAPRAEEGQR